MAKLRRPGSPWRILVHEWLGKKHRSQGNDACEYGKSWHVANDPRFGGGGEDSEWSKHITLPGTEFDELVIGRWIHLEQMDETRWWINIGGVTVWVTADRDGRPKHITVYGPGDYDEPTEGCEYELSWSQESEGARQR